MIDTTKSGHGPSRSATSPRRASARSTRASLCAAFCAILLSLSGAAGGQAGPLSGTGAPVYRSEAAVDWSRRVLTVGIGLDIAAAGLRLPAGRLEAERMVERDLPALAQGALFGLPVDSYRDVETTAQDGTIDVNALLALPRGARRSSAAFTKDMGTFRAVYEFRLSDIASLYARIDSLAARRAPPLSWRPSRAYTGIVVYAKGELPVHGEGVMGRAEPCLFPRIFDDSMSPFLDKGMVDGDVVVGEGPAGYADALGIEASLRVGDDPLRVMAIELFGDGRTDYVISRDDALRALALPGNRELIARGRVLIVIDDIGRKLD
jgi:hypothetical protein